MPPLPSHCDVTEAATAHRRWRWRAPPNSTSSFSTTSADDAALAEKAHTQGIAFLKKPFYPADLEWVLCGFCGLRALSPARR